MQTRLWRHFDYFLFLITLLLILYGVAMIYSATLSSVPNPFLDDSPVSHQIIYASVGLALFIAVAVIDYHVYATLAVPLYLLAIIMLGTVVATGQMSYGARRWLDTGLFALQPSEFTKLIIIIALAKFLSDNRSQIKKLRSLPASLGLMIPPLLLVYLQPNLGTMIIFVAIWVGMLVMAGTRLPHLALLGIGGLLALPLTYGLLLHEYMRERLRIFFDPTSDPLGAGYNILQAEISIGSGGFWGKGLGQGTQTQLDFLRVQRTDFIFSVIGEEMGFVGAMVLFSLFLILLLRGIRISALSPDPFGRLLAMGIVTMILFQVFLNVGVNMRILPTTGIPLPLISYGGSSLITVLISLGILESIALRRKRPEP